MKTYPIVTLGFYTSHPRGLTETAGHLTKTEIRFLDQYGEVARLVRRIHMAAESREVAFQRSLRAPRFIRPFWNLRADWYRDRKDYFLERARTATAALLSAHTIVIPGMQPIEVNTYTSDAGFRTVERHELLRLAKDLDEGEHLWFSIKEA